jgi:apolipoprotein N-acyltransferase
LVKVLKILQVIAPLLLACAFEPLGIWFAAPIAFAIYLYVLSRHARPITYSIYFGLTANLIILYWSGAYVGVLPWVSLAILQALYFIPVGILARYTSNLPFLIAAILLMEEVKARFPFGGFAWTRIAFSQIDSPLAVMVSIGGALSLSFVTLLLSYLAIERKKSTALILLLCAVIPSLLLPSANTKGKLTFTAVQGGTPSKGLDFNSRAMGVLNMHLSESYRSVSGKEDLIIWPENAIDIDPLKNRVVRKKIRDLVEATGSPLLAGAVLSKGPINAAILFKEDGEVGSMYFKRYLTPFGEYMPLRTISEALSPFAQLVNDFEPGQALKIHRVKNAKIASIICFEIINDGIVREAAKKSEILVVHTNSATFAGTYEGDQQLAITRLRALEHNRHVVSISTTGPSAVVSNRGEVIDALRDGEIGSLTGDVHLYSGMTISDKFDGFTPVLTLLTALIWALVSLVNRREKMIL